MNNNKKMKRRQKDLEMVQNETQEKAHLEREMKLLRPLAEMRPFSSSPCTKGRKLFAGKCCAELSAGSSCNSGACTCRGKQRRWSECAGTVKHRGANMHMFQNCGRTSLCVEKHGAYGHKYTVHLSLAKVPAQSTRGSSSFQFQPTTAQYPLCVDTLCAGLVLLGAKVQSILATFGDERCYDSSFRRGESRWGTAAGGINGMSRSFEFKGGEAFVLNSFTCRRTNITSIHPSLHRSCESADQWTLPVAVSRR